MSDSAWKKKIENKNKKQEVSQCLKVCRMHESFNLFWAILELGQAGGFWLGRGINLDTVNSSQYGLKLFFSGADNLEKSIRLCHADPEWAYSQHCGQKVLPEISRTRLSQVPFLLARYTFLFRLYAPCIQVWIVTGMRASKRFLKQDCFSPGWIAFRPFLLQ